MKKKTVVITVIIVSISAFLALLIFLGGIIFVLFGSRKISVNANTQMSGVYNMLNSSVPNVNIASETVYINDYSYVKVDANTGQICDYEFWDGAIDD